MDPVTVTTAIFFAIFLTDLFNGNYKALPVLAVAGFFCVLLVAMVQQMGLYGTAWLLVASPFLFLLGSIMIRDRRIQISESKTLKPAPAPAQNKYACAPYFM
jgi:uncharacterized membrane protein YjjP (DUF1212 family)